MSIYPTINLQEMQRTEEHVRSHHRDAFRKMPAVTLQQVKQPGFLKVTLKRKKEVKEEFADFFLSLKRWL